MQEESLKSEGGIIKIANDSDFKSKA